jgi:hypothetical protein
VCLRVCSEPKYGRTAGGRDGRGGIGAATARYLSLGAGVQSSTCLLLAVHGRIPTFDAAIFADTGREPGAVYEHLDRLEAIAAPAGIPIVRVTAGSIRRDALEPHHRFASMPLFTLGPAGEHGMARRQCTTVLRTRRRGVSGAPMVPSPAVACVGDGGVFSASVRRPVGRYVCGCSSSSAICWTRDSVIPVCCSTASGWSVGSSSTSGRWPTGCVWTWVLRFSVVGW